MRRPHFNTIIFATLNTFPFKTNLEDVGPFRNEPLTHQHAYVVIIKCVAHLFQDAGFAVKQQPWPC